MKPFFPQQHSEPCIRTTCSPCGIGRVLFRLCGGNFECFKREPFRHFASRDAALSEQVHIRPDLNPSFRPDVRSFSVRIYSAACDEYVRCVHETFLIGLHLQNLLASFVYIYSSSFDVIPTSGAQQPAGQGIFGAASTFGSNQAMSNFGSFGQTSTAATAPSFSFGTAAPSNSSNVFGSTSTTSAFGKLEVRLLRSLGDF